MLAAHPFSDTALEQIKRAIQGKNCGVLTCCAEGADQCVFTYQSDSGTPRHWRMVSSAHGGGEPPRFDVGPARVHLMSFAALAHPESAVAAAKQGCDLIVTCLNTLSPVDRLLAGARTIEGVAVVACAPTGAGIRRPPQGHQRWSEETAGIGENCRCSLDTQQLRSRNFQDSIDFEVLLNGWNDVDQ